MANKPEGKDQGNEPLWRPSLLNSVLRPLGWALDDIWHAAVNNLLLFLEEALERQRMRATGEAAACPRWIPARQPARSTPWQRRKNGRRW